jgi:ribonuclease Z
MGKGSTVLLHEATFEDAMLSDAISKRHSTISEALEVGRQMEAKVIVLTHFSQRYREMPLVDKLAVKQAPDTSRRSERPRSRSHSRSRSSSPSKAASEKKYIPSAVLDVPPSDETEVDYTFRPAAGEVEARHTLEHVPVIQAFDHMRLRVEDALHAEAYMPVFKKHLLSKEGEPKEAEDGKKGENETKKNKKGRKEKKKAEKEKMAEAA